VDGFLVVLAYGLILMWFAHVTWVAALQAPPHHQHRVVAESFCSDAAASARVAKG